jgi:protein phosphatase
MSNSAKNMVSAILSQVSRSATICSSALPDAIPIIRAARYEFTKDPPGLSLSGEFLVVGDLHGDLATLLRILERYSYPPERSYLFLGDYVDRGTCSCGVVLLLFALKVLYPDRVYLIRGNHEFRAVTEVYGFRTECLNCFSEEFYDEVLLCFAELPLYAILNARVFCVHGGIPVKVSGLRDLVKQKDEECSKIAEDLLWSDPSVESPGFRNSYRGKGHLFGSKAVSDFLDQTGLSFVIRSHEMCQEGYDYPFGGAGGVMTVFSSCDYCGNMNDSGVVLVGKRKMDADYFEPITEEDEAQRRIAFPEWLLEYSPLDSIDLLVEIDDPVIV